MIMAPKKVCIIGSGNWGSAIAKIVGTNVGKLDIFDTTVNMWVFEETVNGRKLTEIINTDHENVKYLPGHKLPPQHFCHTSPDESHPHGGGCSRGDGCCEGSRHPDLRYSTPVHQQNL
eukprot:XP_014023682.1 PREDICTED: glycerol-3-phosphate dehydrogenase [NAD(+)], cytoplasmic-like [Salmo salar]